MDRLRQILNHFYDVRGQFSNNFKRHSTWIAYNCWAVRQHYSILSPRGKKTKEFIEHLDFLGVEYHKPTNEKVETVVLSNLLVHNLNNPNAVETVISVLEENCIIFKESDPIYQDYLNSLRVMDRLTGEKGGDKNLYTRISYINKFHKYNQGEMSKILLPVFQNLDPNILAAWTTTLGETMSVSVTKQFDANELLNTKNKTDYAKVIRNIKLYEKEEGMNTIPLFIGKTKPSISMNNIYVSEETMNSLKEKGNLLNEMDESYIVDGKRAHRKVYKLHGVDRIEINNHNLEGQKDDSFNMSYTIKFPFVDLYDFVMEVMKAN